MQRLQIDVALLQEVWHPLSETINIRNYVSPIMKLRQGSEGGGVAIITHQNVKSVHLLEYDRVGLEAVWADVMVHGLRAVVGSVYIAPGDIKALAIFEEVVDRILCKHPRLLIAMDANARNSIWDDSCLGISHHTPSYRMGLSLEEIISKHCLQVHNDGSPTYRSGKVATAPDVTLSKGFCNYSTVTWSVADDDLCTPHECILVSIGDRAPVGRVDVVDWPRFNWTAYCESTSDALNKLYEKWVVCGDNDIDTMVQELTLCIQGCVDEIATTRTITRHSKPWFNPEISERCKKLRTLRRKSRYHKSPANVSFYKQFLNDTIVLIKEAERNYWVTECGKLALLDDKAKWKVIDRLTNQHSGNQVQPVRSLQLGEQVYLFEDSEIVTEMEKHHILVPDPDIQTDDILQFLQHYEVSARNYSVDDLMNAPISEREVEVTFGTGSSTPGPDSISSTLLDKADRTQITRCLLLLWNQAWSCGYFSKDWKSENRVVIPKPGKDDYHQCGSYRTISITSCLGKRFERISSQRLVAILADLHFDPLQFAYLKNRSTTQALLMVVEKVKQGLIAGNKAGVVFFDFTDAFGRVDRKCLLYKLAKDFGINGKLFLHIASFLSDRIARVKVNGHYGEWIESMFGTSAGTNLGPLLFIMYLHDIPVRIFPKFADDLVSVAVDSDMLRITKELQHSVDDLVSWSQKWGMVLNVSKTKVMLFGDVEDDVIELKMYGADIEQVDKVKYLGVWLDHQLNFSCQVDHAILKAKRSAAKVCTLFDGRDGLSVRLGVQLYKSLVQPHLEYAVPVWAAASEKDLDKVEQTQVQCLKRITGAKTHSSGSAIEVITGTYPIKIRIRELCSREYLRIMFTDQGNQLRQLYNTSSRKGLRFCPLNYLSVMAKQLSRRLDGCVFSTEHKVSATAVLQPAKVTKVSVTSSDSFDFCNKSQLEKQNVVAEVLCFLEANKTKSVMVFTDGSVYDAVVGCGACAAVLVPLAEDDDNLYDSKAVGKNVASLRCELEGIILGLELSVKYYQSSNYRKNLETLYILCDCSAAIDVIVNRMYAAVGFELFTRLSCLAAILSDMNVKIVLAWIPGHQGIPSNDTADCLAKETAREIYRGQLAASCYVTYNDAVRIAADIARKSWQRKWDQDVSGCYTRNLIPEVGTKVCFPDKRDIGISYCRLLLHDTMLRDDSHRTGTSDTPVCACGLERETAEHYLLYCNRFEEARNRLKDALLDISDLSGRRKQLCLSEALLLAPKSDVVTRKEEKFIKEALFEFISETGVKI